MSLRVAIAGASGFVGSALAQKISDKNYVIGLSRLAKTPAPRSGISEWRACDLFSLRDAEQALQGVDVAYYLVHSMMPSARLSQGAFEDMDLITADNFARAAAKAGVKQIFYLSGLTPQSGTLSRHLQSRWEVEQVLRAYGNSVTTLRAGLIIGPQGSSFQMLYRLVKRLPAMICPRWTDTPTHPIADVDVVSLLSYCLENPQVWGETYDIGGPDVVTYREMILLLARLMGVSRHLIRFPFFTPGLSRLWVSLVTGAPSALVTPLVQSLTHPMVAKDRRLQAAAGLGGLSLEKALSETLAQMGNGPLAKPLAFVGNRGNALDSVVRSVQRLPLPLGRDASWAALEYANWLPHRFFFLRVRVEGNFLRFYIRFIPMALLVLEYSIERSAPDRSLYYIRGGLLAQAIGRGRLEFRESWNRKFLISAIHDYRPSLPWFIYRYTQAKVHLYVMAQFGRHLARVV